jgi:hypothetical protein
MELTKIEEKTMRFMTALTDVYRDEESRELALFSPAELGEDVTEDFTAMLLAMKIIFVKLTGSDSDLIDFTHLLNKVAVQYVIEKLESDDER